MKIRVSVFLANVLVILMILATFYLLQRANSIFNNSQQIAENNKYLGLLARELSDSSKSLTQAVRLYVANNDMSFKERYDNVVDVRSGKKARAHDAAVAPGQNVALLDLLLKYGITKDEFALLEQANALSNALIASEVEAMHAMQGRFKDASGAYTKSGPPDKELAMQLVFGTNYENELKKIQHPLNTFREKLNARISAVEQDIKSGFEPTIYAAIICMALSILFAFISYIFVHKFVVIPIEKITDYANKVGRGDLSSTLDIYRKDELGQVANALRHIPENISSIIAEYNRLTDRVAHGELEVRGGYENLEGDFIHLISGTNAILDRFCMLLDKLPSPVIILDQDKRINYLNEIAKKLCGKEAYGNTCYDVFTPDDRDTPNDSMQKAYTTLKATHGETTVHISGLDMDVLYTATPLLSENNTFTCMFLLVTDVSDIKKFQKTILEVSEHVAHVSTQTVTATEQLSAKIQDVASGAEDQKERVMRTSAAMEEMTATVIEVSQNAEEARVQAEDTQEKAREGATLVEEVVIAIGDVNSVSNELAESIKSLGAQAEAIGSVMSVISDIADQTNLLALNAAIEAARAGDAGRGFAVVADEVRKLAEKTMTATTEVGNSIKNIQQSTTLNITHFNKTMKLIDNATQLANTSGQALAQIRNLAEKNASLITAIATASEQQSATSEEINSSVDDVNQIASHISEQMLEATADVQSLTVFAGELQDNLSKLSSFKTK